MCSVYCTLDIGATCLDVGNNQQTKWFQREGVKWFKSPFSDHARNHNNITNVKVTTEGSDALGLVFDVVVA